MSYSFHHLLYRTCPVALNTQEFIDLIALEVIMEKYNNIYMFIQSVCSCYSLQFLLYETCPEAVNRCKTPVEFGRVKLAFEKCVTIWMETQVMTPCFSLKIRNSHLAVLVVDGHQYVSSCCNHSCHHHY